MGIEPKSETWEVCAKGSLSTTGIELGKDLGKNSKLQKLN
jgi:hypothetical protein